ncbi:N-acylmannosamine kinase [Collibacillus ludicampi]|jgi:glucokinase|uniref:N-acylmannosamine kinase n=1 Tax=Collibacillus ludicampi TaxID=2771369 RepID=A0AAV4LAB9_9BACL|nr:ROK family protein [Collibacillus ludicampi]GIM44716.1 N-acylmannosamine kinase [Collibacillus ludicampi]
MFLLGIDIGGTKTAVILGKEESGQVEIIDRREFQTISGNAYTETINKIESLADSLIRQHVSGRRDVAALGISCGGPLDSRNGMILSPPNLPGWNRVPIVAHFQQKFGIPAAIQNDANACALAEWKWGAGKGTKNMIFLTFGTGMGAGLILNGQLYSGTNDMAGEVGHIRLEKNGPVGFGKRGSFEGFCSGGGISQLAKNIILEKQQQGEEVWWCKTSQEFEKLSAKTVAEALQTGDPVAKAIYQEVGYYLGRGLSILIDILNPQKIVLGSIYVRQEEILAPIVTKVVESEALFYSRKVCQIVPARLGERLGDYAALSVASHKAMESTIKG